MKKLIIILLLLFIVGCGMTPAQKNAVNELDKTADYFVKYVKPYAEPIDKDVIDANKALAKELAKECK